MKVKQLLDNFKTPPREYYPAPFWFLNDELDERHLKFQLDEMYDKGIYEVLLHARLGLAVKYLSEEWFKKIGYILEICRENGMKAWFYDEENWPSGYAGGRVLEQNPDFCGKCLNRFKKGQAPDGYVQIKETEEYIYAWGDYRYHPAYSDSFYVDVLNPLATDCFIDLTHKEYTKRFADYYGDTVLGFFVDEPGFYNNFEMYNYCDNQGSYIWTRGFPDYFKEEKGYDLLDKIELLYAENEEARQVKVDFYDVASKMYKEYFLQRLADYCHSVGLKLIGHLHSEEFLPYHVKTQGDMISCMEPLDWSGVDRIDTNGEKITEKYGSSAAHIYGQEFAMSETFALSGWDLDFHRMRQWTNYQAVRGINKIVLHAFYSSIEGDRKWECPPTLFFQNHYWKYFKNYSDFCARVSFASSCGTYRAPAAVYYPITTQQELVGPYDILKAAEQDKLFLGVCTALLEKQLDFDILNDWGLERSKIQGGKLAMNGMEYNFVVLVGLTNIPYSSLKKIAEFSKSGGHVIYIGKFDIKKLDDCTDAQFKEAIKSLVSQNWYHINEFWFTKPYTYVVSPYKIADYAFSKNLDNVRLETDEPSIKYMERIFEDGRLYYFINEDKDVKRVRAFVPRGENAYLLDAASGEIYRYEIKDAPGEKSVIEFDIDGYSERIFALGGRFDYPKLNKGFVTDEFRLDGKWHLTSKAINGEYEAQLWGDLGYPFFSGEVTYRKKFTIRKNEGRRYLLAIRDLYCCASVTLNSRFAGDMIWNPHELDVTHFLRDGENEIEIRVCNTLANELEKKYYLSGIRDIRILEQNAEG